MSLKNSIESLTSVFPGKAESIAPATSYITNGFVFTWGALTFNQIMMLIGTIFAIATYFTSLYYQRRRDKREHELHVQRLRQESAPSHPPTRPH